ncbi:RraA family protein [Tumebacillus sp. ITR2]|uniref:Putative 4-hydroxy-4-methyl-2-oxoglutarate aldolase n=1 Tax=Tumebacillus amylolyticus TaxID=2801339 RepID=A0ABS1J9Q4_9BACL|nr:RraA family protein [Tumebacillus amylolyticus]MBL0386368.1 RraA family protein [Tumebacillus amylolyticus]
MTDQWMEELRDLDTASISDALDSLGVNGGLEGLVPRSANVDLCGRAFTVEFGLPSEEETKVATAADYIDEVSAGEVVILANNGRTDCTIWGGILTTMATIKGVAGTVIDGACRDVEEIQEKNYAMYTKSVYMKTGKGRAKKRNHQVPVRVNDVVIQPGDYVRGDANGVLVIPQDMIEETVRRAKAIRDTEANIVEALHNGVRLEDARVQFKYNRPWEKVGV